MQKKFACGKHHLTLPPALLVFGPRKPANKRIWGCRMMSPAAGTLNDISHWTYKAHLRLTRRFKAKMPPCMSENTSSLLSCKTIKGVKAWHKTYAWQKHYKCCGRNDSMTYGGNLVSWSSGVSRERRCLKQKYLLRLDVSRRIKMTPVQRVKYYPQVCLHEKGQI